MAYISPEGIVIPSGTDTYNLTTDLRTQAASTRSVIPVANNAGATSVISAMAADGRTATDTNPAVFFNSAEKGTQIYGTDAVLRPMSPQAIFGHMGKTNGFTAGTDQNPVTGMSGLILRGGMTVDSANNALVVPIAGLYRLTGKCYTSGSATGGSLYNLVLNSGGTISEPGGSVWWTKQQVDEIMGIPPVIRALAAGDKISMRARQPASTWGSSGFDGCWIEVEYIGPA